MSNRVNKRRKHSKVCTAIILLTLVVLTVVVYANIQSLKAQTSDYSLKVSELQEQLEAAQEEYEELEATEKYMATDEYVEDVARNQLGLVYPDEIIIRPSDN